MTRSRAAALSAALAAGAVGCAKVQTASVYLEVANGLGAPRPDQVRIDIYAPAGAGQLGAPLKSFPALDPQAGGDLLGTLVIYPGAELTGLTIRAQGLTGGQVKSQGSVEVAIVPKQQVTARITLAPATAGDAGADAGEPGDAGGEAGGDGGAPDDDAGTRGGDGRGPDDDGGTPDVGIDSDAGPPDGDGGGSADVGRDLAGDQGGTPTDARNDGPLPDAPDAGGPPIIISVDFVGASPTPMAPTEQAGVVPTTRWSSAVGGIGTLAALVDGNGAATTASISWNAGAANNIYLSSIADVAGNNRMMNGYLDPTNGQVATITVSALPSALAVAGYDVYVYTNGSVPTGETRTFNYAIGATTFTLTQTMAQIFNGTFVLAATGGSGNYVVFRGIVGATFTVTATPGTSTSMFMRAPVDGVQIVGR